MLSIALLACAACTSESTSLEHHPLPAGTIPPTPVVEHLDVAAVLAPRPDVFQPRPRDDGPPLPPLREELVDQDVAPAVTSSPDVQPTPTPGAASAASVATDYAAPPPTGTLSQSQFYSVLDTVAWPQDLYAEALRVACGVGNVHHPSGESGCRPDAQNGRYKGLFQLDTPFWFLYCKTDPELWYVAEVNVATALCVGQYDLEHGYDFMSQWEAAY